MTTFRHLIVALAFSAAFAPWVSTQAETHPGEAALVREVAADTGKAPARLKALLDAAQKQQSILDAISRPAESKAWKDYRQILVTPARIREGTEFYRAHRALIDSTAKKYAVAPSYLVAILGVETRYGRITGHYKVLDALVTLAFYYPPRAKFFRNELKTLLELPDNKLAGPLGALTGSYAGAQGWGQFMPSSIRAYAVDADHDGHTDLHGSLADILASVANYFHQHGWRAGAEVAVPAQLRGNAKAVRYLAKPPQRSLQQYDALGYTPLHKLPPGTTANLLTLQGARGPEHWFTLKNFYVITRYNHSPMYAMAVHQIADAIAAKVNDPVPAEGVP